MNFQIIITFGASIQRVTEQILNDLANDTFKAALTRGLAFGLAHRWHQIKKNRGKKY